MTIRDDKNQGNGRDWRTLCEQVLTAKDPEEINGLLEELLEVLDGLDLAREAKSEQKQA